MSKLTAKKSSGAPTGIRIKKNRGNPNPQPHPENLRPPWKPGESGNPAGTAHTPEVVLSRAYAAVLRKRVPGDPLNRTFAELIAEQQAREAIKGNVQSAKEIRQATEGDVLHTPDWRERARKNGLDPDEIKAAIIRALKEKRENGDT